MVVNVSRKKKKLERTMNAMNAVLIFGSPVCRTSG